MVVKKNQIMFEIDKEVRERVAAAVVVIDKRLTEYKGDTVVVNLKDIGISVELGNFIYNEAVGKLIKIYKEAGWEVDYSNSIGETSRFIFK